MVGMKMCVCACKCIFLNSYLTQEESIPHCEAFGRRESFASITELQESDCNLCTWDSQNTGTWLGLGQHTLLSGALKLNQITQRPRGTSDIIFGCVIKKTEAVAVQVWGRNVNDNVLFQLFLGHQFSCIYSSAFPGSCFISTLGFLQILIYPIFMLKVAFMLKLLRFCQSQKVIY